MFFLLLSFPHPGVNALPILMDDKPVTYREEGKSGKIHINVSPKLSAANEGIFVQVWLVGSNDVPVVLKQPVDVIFNWTGSLDRKPILRFADTNDPASGKCIVSSSKVNEKIVLQAHVPGYGYTFETVRIETTFLHTFGRILFGSALGLALLVTRYFAHEKGSSDLKGTALVSAWLLRLLMSVLTSGIAFIWSKTELPLGSLPFQPSDDASLVILGFMTCYVGSDLILGPLSKKSGNASP